MALQYAIRKMALLEKLCIAQVNAFNLCGSVSFLKPQKSEFIYKHM